MHIRTKTFRVVDTTRHCFVIQCPDGDEVLSDGPIHCLDSDEIEMANAVSMLICDQNKRNKIP